MVIPNKLKDRVRERYRLISMGESMKMFKKIKEHVQLDDETEDEQKEQELIQRYRRGRGGNRKASFTSKLFWFATLKEEDESEDIGL